MKDILMAVMIGFGKMNIKFHICFSDWQFAIAQEFDTNYLALESALTPDPPDSLARDAPRITGKGCPSYHANKMPWALDQ